MKMNKYIFLILLLFSTVSHATRIEKITVDGNQRIEKETILSYLHLKKGDNFSREDLSKAIKSLYKTELFSNVMIKEENGNLEVLVIENPIINIISFEGNKRIRDEMLSSVVSIQPRSVYTKTRVSKDLKKIKETYKYSGYFSAKIEPKLIVLDSNRVNLIFEIEEGHKAKIKHINILGNRAFPDDVLKRKLATAEYRWYRFLSTNDSFNYDRLAYDEDLLRRFYLSKGYADFSILSITSETTPNKEDFYLTIKVNEGERYKIGDLSIESKLSYLNSAELNKVLKEDLKSGDWYNVSKVEKAILDLTTSAENMQYAFAKVTPIVDKNDETKKISLTFNISEGAKTFVNKVNITGNERTRDEVIRREVKLLEGDAFNRDKLVKSERDLRNLDYFDSVNVDVAQVDNGLTDINIDVAEKSTGAISMGAGFSTDDGPLADFSISENNFLGKGQKVKFGTSVSGESQQVDFSFTEPYFLGRDLSAGFDLYNIEKDYSDESSYEKKLTGLALRIGYPLSDEVRQRFKYKIEKNDIFNVENDASAYIKSQEGAETISSISHEITYDSRDSIIDPTEGTVLTMKNELAGLGGAKFIKNIIGGGFYTPLADSWIFSNYSELGNIMGYGGEDASVSNRFFIGGRTLRGFEKSGLGPRDKATGDALGGENYFKNSTELSFPLGVGEDLGLRGFSFMDIGSLWGVSGDSSDVYDEQKLRGSLGFGLSWKSSMGVLRLNFAYPFMSQDYDKDEVFSFSFGTRF